MESTVSTLHNVDVNFSENFVQQKQIDSSERIGKPHRTANEKFKFVGRAQIGECLDYSPQREKTLIMVRNTVELVSEGHVLRKRNVAIGEIYTFSTPANEQHQRHRAQHYK